MLGWSAFGIFAFPLGTLADAIGLRATLVRMGLTALLAGGALQWRTPASVRVLVTTPVA
jgi:hypothetical protein